MSVGASILNFSDLYSYSTERSSQSKLFNMYICSERKQRKILNAKLPARNVLKRQNFDRLHREAI